MEEFLKNLTPEQRALYESFSDEEKAVFEAQVTEARATAAAQARTTQIAELARAAGTTVARSVVHASAPSGNRGELTAVERAGQVVDAILRGYNTTAAAELIDEQFVPELMETAVGLTPFLDEKQALVIPMNRDVLKFPVLGATGSISTEAQAEGADYAGGTDADFNEVTLVAQKYGRVVPVSEELIEGSPIQILALLRKLFARQIASLVEYHAFNGNGSTQPEGILTKAGVVKTASTATTSEELERELNELYFAQKAEYRNNGTWFVTSRGMAKLNSLRDSAGHKILSAPTNEKPFSTLLGRPVRETEGLSDGVDGSANAVTTIVFADLSRYAVGDRSEVTVKQDNSIGFKSDTVHVKVSLRYDMKVGLTEAFRALTAVKL